MRSKLVVIMLFAQINIVALSQDLIPKLPSKGAESSYVLPMRSLNMGFDEGTFEAILPAVFKGASPSKISGEIGTLDSFFNKLGRMHRGLVIDSVRVLHVGDSHIRGRFFTNALSERLTSVFPALKYEDYGINGATTRTFIKPDRIQKIASFAPDLLILSFGTNESHNRGYNNIIHYSQMVQFISEIRKVLPYTPILLTTPPGSFERRARRAYRVNPRTSKAVETICLFANDHHLPFWDVFSIVGGGEYACNNWNQAKLMRPDRVHYLPEGYKLQADLFYEALIRAYNEYVTY